MTTPDDPWLREAHQRSSGPGGYGQPRYLPHEGANIRPQPSEPSSLYDVPGSPQRAWTPQDYQPQQPLGPQYPPGTPPAPQPGGGPRSSTYIMLGLSCLVVIVGVGGFIAGRKTAPHPSTPLAARTATAPATPAGKASSAAPVTAAAAQSAATAFFSLYAAGQYAATYPLLAPLARHKILMATWVTVHQRCRSSAAGLSYKVGTATLAGRSAVMSISLAGVASKLGSEEVTFVYRGGKWLYAPSDLASYQGTSASIITRLRAAGNCG